MRSAWCYLPRTHATVQSLPAWNVVVHGFDGVTDYRSISAVSARGSQLVEYRRFGKCQWCVAVAVVLLNVVVVIERVGEIDGVRVEKHGSWPFW